MITYLGSKVVSKARSGYGHIYVVLFKDGMIKVGYTTGPKPRFRSICDAACLRFNPATHVWLSKPHTRFKDNETRMLGLLVDLATERIKQEYFRGLDFFDTVATSTQLVERYG
jgi:hypothetical protein